MKVPYQPVFGVFYYRSPRRKTLETLARFLPVPVEAIVREFESGLSAEEICARSVRDLRRIGASKVYISNLGFRNAAKRYDRIMNAIEHG